MVIHVLTEDVQKSKRFPHALEICNRKICASLVLSGQDANTKDAHKPNFSSLCPSHPRSYLVGLLFLFIHPYLTAPEDVIKVPPNIQRGLSCAERTWWGGRSKMERPSTSLNWHVPNSTMAWQSQSLEWLLIVSWNSKAQSLTISITGSRFGHFHWQLQRHYVYRRNCCHRDIATKSRRRMETCTFTAAVPLKLETQSFAQGCAQGRAETEEGETKSCFQLTTHVAHQCRAQQSHIESIHNAMGHCHSLI